VKYALPSLLTVFFDGLLAAPCRTEARLTCKVRFMDFVVSNIVWIVLALASGLGLLLPLLRGRNANQVSPAQAVMLINRQRAVMIDVRDAAEVEKSKIANALAIPLGELADKAKELTKYKSRPVIVLCANGSRAVTGVETLTKAGFEQVFSLEGGLKAWKDAGQPVISGSKS
jgi:rhodanese-related sulfurtransferase